MLEKLANASKAGGSEEVPGPSEYKFRLFIEMEVSGKGLIYHVRY